jgi:hypothetical protein
MVAPACLPDDVMRMEVNKTLCEELCLHGGSLMSLCGCAVACCVMLSGSRSIWRGQVASLISIGAWHVS